MVFSGVAKPDRFELPDGTPVAILYEDRGVLAIDKPAGWMLGPDDAEHNERSLHRALVDAIEAGEWWTRSRNLKFLRFVHRLDAPTTGILLLSKSQGGMTAFSRVFAERVVKKCYLAVTDSIPRQTRWTCTEPLGPDPESHGKHMVDRRNGKEAETSFEVLGTREGRALVLARPITGRTHQIRLHMAYAGCPVSGDILYGRRDFYGLALRAIRMEYPDPFLKRKTVIVAPVDDFCRRYGFPPDLVPADVRTFSPKKTAPKSDDAPGSAVNTQGKPPARPAQPHRRPEHGAQRRGSQGGPDRPRGDNRTGPKQ